MPPDPSDDPREPEVISPIGEGFTWVARITGVGLVMTLPTAAGAWLDARLGTGLFAPVGLVVGFVAGLAGIVGMAGRTPPRRKRRERRPESSARTPPP